MKRNKNQFEMARREFLRKAGKVGLSTALLRATPLTGMLLGTGAFAQTQPKRIIFVYVPDGARQEFWIPTGGALPGMSAGLESVRQRVAFLDGVSMQGAGHGRTSKALAGGSNPNTLDVLVANSAFAAGTPFKNLQVGVLTEGDQSKLTRVNHGETAYEDNPFNVFDRLFGGGGFIDADNVEADPRQRLEDIIATANDGLDDLRGSLGAEDRTRLDIHQQSLEAVGEQLLGSIEEPGEEPGAGGGEEPEAIEQAFSDLVNNSAINGPASPVNRNSQFLLGDNFHATSNLHIELITLALQLDKTRVVSLMLGNHQSEYKIPEAGIDKNYHAAIHNNSLPEYVTYRNYFTGQVARLIQRLDDTGLLDSTLIMQVADMGDGVSHSGENLPYMFAGRGINNPGVINVNNDYKVLLNSVAQVSGITDRFEIDGTNNTVIDLIS